jgi:hypothetical protein
VTTLFSKGEKVVTSYPASFLVEHGTVGEVVEFHDWWIMVKLEKSGIVYPFMEGELKHV